MTGNVKHLVVIQSLGDEIKTGTNLYGDIISRKIDYKALRFTHRFYDIGSKAELQHLLKYYEDDSLRYEDGLVIHLEMHGADDQSGLILSNGELVSWEDLVDWVRPINIGTRNNFYITMATCFGRFLYKGVDPNQKSPYAAFISASEAVSVEQVEQNFSDLYETLLDNGNLIEAYLLMEKGGTKFFYKDSKTCFEDAFASTFEKLHGDMNLKEEIIADARIKVLKETGKMLTEQEGEMIFRQALQDTYQRHLNAFIF